VEKIIQESYLEAQRILKEKRTLLDKIAEALLEKETLEKEEYDELIGLKSEEKAEEKNEDNSSIKKDEKNN